MKKILVIVIFLFVFLIGIKIGNSYTISDSNIFENNKNEFEQEIVNQDNDYNSSNHVLEENLSNKIARKIDETIEKILGKILNSLE
jgi:uncharacterized membrane protein SpoIIM required for sporulation